MIEQDRYAALDETLLRKHSEDTISEDIKSFSSQLNNHFAHVIMLVEQNIIEKEVGAKIIRALLRLREEGVDNIGFKPSLTDLYSNVEEWLIEELGIKVGGSIHTGRSRNDMNSTIERMHLRDKILELTEAITFLMQTLLTEAHNHKETIIPAYTHHSQQAQPITLGHFYSSCFQMFTRDMQRLFEAYPRVNMSTMGGAAIATTSFPINRERTAELLGFDGFLENSMDATATVDFAIETAAVMAVYINNIGRMIESLLLWNMNEVGISRLAFKFCSYSTIMPQKRNPVSLESLRYSGTWTYGALSAMLNTMKAYTQGNGREPGFVTSLCYDIAEKIIESTYLLEGIVRTLEVDKERAMEVTSKGLSTVTDLADAMVKDHGLSFAAAKKIVGRVVEVVQDERLDISDVDSVLVNKIARDVLQIDLQMKNEEIKNALDPMENVLRRQIIGGPSPQRVQEMIDKGKLTLEEFIEIRQEKENKLKEKNEILLALAREYAREQAE